MRNSTVLGCSAYQRCGKILLYTCLLEIFCGRKEASRDILPLCYCTDLIASTLHSELLSFTPLDVPEEARGADS